MAEIRHKYYCF